MSVFDYKTQNKRGQLPNMLACVLSIIAIYWKALWLGSMNVPPKRSCARQCSNVQRRKDCIMRAVTLSVD